MLIDVSKKVHRKEVASKMAKDKLSEYISTKLIKEDRSIRWMARQIGISNVHLGAILEGKQSWSPKILKNVSKALTIPLLQLYVMSGLIADSDLEQYSIEQSLGDELVQLLSVPGVREICHRIKRLINKYPHYSTQIVPSILSQLDCELAICQMWARNDKKKKTE